MSITIELTYEMTKLLGEPRFEIAGAATVAEALNAAREQFGEKAAQLDQLARVTAIAVNGVLTNHRKGMKTKLNDGDTVAFVKAAAGG